MSAAGPGAAAPEVERAGPGDLRPLAALHRACLPESILTALGAAGVARYYALAIGSPEERVLVVRGGGPGGPLVAGCLLSLAPHTLLRRFALRAPGALARELAGGLVSSDALRRRLVARLGEAARASTPGLSGLPPGLPPGLPEVTQIFTDPGQRGQGLGAKLLRAAEAQLRELGQVAYCVHTLRDANDAGIRFYRREGFTEAGTTRSFGDHYLVMTKGLT
jgi:ribosomal protein S18 acetylase RimI-like enzyme